MTENGGLKKKNRRIIVIITIRDISPYLPYVPYLNVFKYGTNWANYFRILPKNVIIKVWKRPHSTLLDVWVLNLLPFPFFTCKFLGVLFSKPRPALTKQIICEVQCEHSTHIIIKTIIKTFPLNQRSGAQNAI